MTAARSALFSKAVSGATACIIAILAILYLCAVYWSYRLLLRSPRPLNKAIGVKLQRYAPGEPPSCVIIRLVLGVAEFIPTVVYGFLVFSSLAEVCPLYNLKTIECEPSLARRVELALGTVQVQP